ncbi:MAG: hypothetical protein JW830_11945 [Bacteroidales bacterium]|nr:hypothetical protein [Bacteroidales bacterium]
MVCSIPSSGLRISTDNILKSLGVPVDQADDYLMDKIQELILQSVGISSPSACWSVFPDPRFLNETGTMSLEGKIFHLNKMVTLALSKSTRVAFFVGTCGDAVELLSKQLMKDGHSLEGLIVDLIGSEIAEDVADFVHKKIEEDMGADGLKVTNRYSPGYCKWPVSDQQQLFHLLRDNTCGVQLTGSSLMLPIKSVSGIVGIGKDVKNQGYFCSICDADYCLYRDKK